MATTSGSSTTNLGRTLIYLGDKETEAHSNEHGVERRNLVMRGHLVNPDNALQEMYEMMSEIPHDSVEGVMFYQSFGSDELSPDNRDSLLIANEALYRTGEIMFPNTPFIVVTQKDGVGGKVHGHIAAANCDLERMKTLTQKQRSWQSFSHASDSVLKEMETENPGLSFIYPDKTKQGERLRFKEPWKNELADKLDGYRETSKSFEEYRAKAEADGITFRLAKTPNKKSGVRGLSYGFVDSDGKQRSTKASNLGSQYRYDDLILTYEKLADYEKEASPLLDISIDDLLPKQKQAEAKSIDEPKRIADEESPLPAPPVPAPAPKSFERDEEFEEEEAPAVPAVASEITPKKETVSEMGSRFVTDEELDEMKKHGVGIDIKIVMVMPNNKKYLVEKTPEAVPAVKEMTVEKVPEAVPASAEDDMLMGAISRTKARQQAEAQRVVSRPAPQADGPQI